MPRRRSPLPLSASALALALAGCADANGDGGDAPTTTLAVEGLPSPALEGSGEPRLSSAGDRVVLSWLEPVPDGADPGASDAGPWRLRMAWIEGGVVGEPRTVAEGDHWFVNWADFPSVVPVGSSTLLAHWLQRGGDDTYDYGVRVARSTDDGLGWGEPWTPHEDATPTEHGFVSIFPLDDGAGLVWLDGREFASGNPSMTLRARTLGTDGAPGPERLVDPLVCDCCQTDAAATSEGVVVVYRDRTEDEVRDVYAVRLVDGRWTEGRPVHADGWVIGACPVNGPAVDARGADVAVAWFAAPGDSARVQVAFSSDAGATFGAPVRVDGGAPGGRVDVTLLDDGGAAVSWIERAGEGDAEIRLRRVSPDGRAGAPVVVARSSAARTSGFPRMAPDGAGRLLFAWTDVSGAEPVVRLARVDASALPLPATR